MSCGAKHPEYAKTTCTYGDPCPIGRAHNGKHLRFFVNWWDSSNRPVYKEPAPEIESNLTTDSLIHRATEKKKETHKQWDQEDQQKSKRKPKKSDPPASSGMLF